MLRSLTPLLRTRQLPVEGNSARRSFASFKDWLLSRTVVGRDAIATYYETPYEVRPGGVRRTFEPHSTDSDEQLTPEWLSWLHGTRALPPTADETARIAEQRAQVQHNAAERARAEVLRRERARALKHDVSEPVVGSVEPQAWTPPKRGD